MSLIKKCNFCGRHENQKGVIFDTRPIGLKLRSPSKKRSYNLALNITIEDAEDQKAIESLKDNPQFVQDLINGNVGNLQEYIHINEPYPILCNTCKREIIRLIRDYGCEGRYIDFQNISL